MKAQEIIKDLIISILIVFCIGLILAIVFYDDISFSRVIPQSEEYMMPEEMSQELEETDLEEAQEVIVNYYIDAADLKKYEKTNEYNKGKQNPFAVEETPVANNTDNNTNTSSTTNGTENNSGNFYDDGGMK